MSLRLTYFQLTGRAEATRLAFHIGGVKFEDKRISFSEFPDLRPKTPFNALPTLEVGKSYTLLKLPTACSKVYKSTLGESKSELALG